MSQRVCNLLLVFTAALGSPATWAYQARICTERGAIDIDVDEQRAPLEAANFARLVQEGFYVGTVFHRVVDGELVQGGTYTAELERRETPDALGANRAGAAVSSFNGLSNVRGTIGVSRASDPDSATAGFFINLDDNRHLDSPANQPGYTVFGRISGGLEVLDAIAALPTRRLGSLDAVPSPLIEIESVTLIEGGALFGLSIAPDPAAIRRAIATAEARNDPGGILAAIDRLRETCIALDNEQRITEAEAALTLGRIDRARYGLEQYLARADARDPSLARVRRLYQSLPRTETNRDIEQLIGHCRRPLAPSIPDSRVAEAAVMQVVESAILRYRQLGEFYLQCLAEVIESGGLNAAETESATRRHNELVLELTSVQMRYNRAVRQLGLGQAATDPSGFDQG